MLKIRNIYSGLRKFYRNIPKQDIRTKRFLFLTFTLYLILCGYLHYGFSLRKIRKKSNTSMFNFLNIHQKKLSYYSNSSNEIINIQVFHVFYLHHRRNNDELC